MSEIGVMHTKTSRQLGVTWRENSTLAHAPLITAFIDSRRAARLGVESICRVLRGQGLQSPTYLPTNKLAACVAERLNMALGKQFTRPDRPAARAGRHREDPLEYIDRYDCRLQSALSYSGAEDGEQDYYCGNHRPTIG